MSFDGDDNGSEDFHRPPSHHHRDPSPDYHYAGGSPAPRVSGAIPSPSQFEPERGPHSAPLYSPVPSPYPYPFLDGRGRGRDRDIRNRDGDGAFHRPRSVSGGRAAAVLPPPGSPRRGSYSSDSGSDGFGSDSSFESDKRDRDRNRKRTGGPLEKARHAIASTFSNSTSGLGVGVLGAIVGGLAAREATERHHHSSPPRGHKHGHGHGHVQANISTIVGAAVGGLGANAIEKRLERDRRRSASHTKNRERDRNREIPWEEDDNIRDVRTAEEGRGFRGFHVLRDVPREGPRESHRDRRVRGGATDECYGM